MYIYLNEELGQFFRLFVWMELSLPEEFCFTMVKRKTPLIKKPPNYWGVVLYQNWIGTFLTNDSFLHLLFFKEIFTTSSKYFVVLYS